jgi:hypothetical protein
MYLLTASGLTLWSAVISSLVTAAPLEENQRSALSPGILWGACDGSLEALKVAGGYNGTIDCANLTVPLDYTNSSSSATIQLNLLHIQVPNGKSKGTVQINLGGPGIPGRSDLASRISIFQTYVL